MVCVLICVTLCIYVAKTDVHYILMQGHWGWGWFDTTCTWGKIRIPALLPLQSAGIHLFAVCLVWKPLETVFFVGNWCFKVLIESARRQNKAWTMIAINLDQLCIWMYMIHGTCTIAGLSRWDLRRRLMFLFVCLLACLFVCLLVCCLVSFLRFLGRLGRAITGAAIQLPYLLCHLGGRPGNATRLVVCLAVFGQHVCLINMYLHSTLFVPDLFWKTIPVHSCIQYGCIETTIYT